MAAATPPGEKGKYVPIFGWLPAYKAGWLRFDVVAGLTVAAVVIPQSMAYATIAGLPVQVGLYVALVPMLSYALLGSSRRLSVSSTSALSILTASALLSAAGPSSSPNDYVIPAATLAILVGTCLLLASFLRLGLLANFISLPVLIGFKAGIGVVIFVSQLGKVLGLSVPSGSSVFETLAIILANLGEINWPTVALAAATLVILVFMPRYVSRIPAALVAVAFGIGLSLVFNLGSAGIVLIGDIPTGLPSISLPDLSLVGRLWLPAVGIALMSFTESTAAARAFREPGEPMVDANHELFALGVANIAGGFFQAYPAGGGTSQTAVNANAGAKTQVAELVTVAVAALTLLFLAPLISLMPEATLGALVLVAAMGLVQINEFRELAQIRRTELMWALLAFVGVILFGILEGILVAIVISLLTLLVQVDHPPVYALGRKPGSNVFRSLEDHPQDETFAGLLIARTEGRVYFANVSRVVDQMWAMTQENPPRVLLLDCSAVPDLEYSALKSLVEFSERLRNAGIILWLAALNPRALHMAKHSRIWKEWRDERMYLNLEQAVEAYVQRYK